MSTNGSGIWVSVDGTCNTSFAIPLEIGSTRPLWIRRTRIEWTGLRRPISLLYASDLHLGTRWSRRVIDELLAAARMTVPDAIVLGGDLADSRRGLQQLEKCVAGLRAISNVWGVAGNHDRILGLANVRSAFESAGGKWLQDRCEHVAVESAGILRIDGFVALQPSRSLCA
jgi:predicted MPP superfamily phosphohydrolase